jgi:hypothetical protein
MKPQPLVAVLAKEQLERKAGWRVKDNLSFSPPSSATTSPFDQPSSELQRGFCRNARHPASLFCRRISCHSIDHQHGRPRGPETTTSVVTRAPELGRQIPLPPQASP